MQQLRFNLTAKLAAIHVLLTASLLALVAVAWKQLPSTTEVELVAQLGRAQQTTQHADMLHDSLRSEVLAVMLQPESSAATSGTRLSAVQSDATEFRKELASLSSMLLPANLALKVDGAQTSAQHYAGLAEQLEQMVKLASSQVPSKKREFDLAFENTKVALEDLTSTIGKQRSAASEAGKQAATAARLWLSIAVAVTAIGGWIVIALIARSIRKSLLRVSNTARAVAAGDLSRRGESQGSDEVGQIADAVNQMADALSDMIVKMKSDAERSAFGARLSSAMDMADSEKQTANVIEKAMQDISSQHAMELLMADSSAAHMERAAQHPTAGAAGCGVNSPYSCIAVRRGHAVTFDHSDNIDACPKLRDRREGPVSAICVPVSFMGRALGVLHACGPVDTPISEDAEVRIKTLGGLIGSRIGTVRSFERTQIQARTDALTGLANRRSAEVRLRQAVRAGRPFVLVLADLDRFKSLNDTYGHRAGDEALRLFATVVRDGVRPQDLASRWGGEEFCFLLDGMDAEQAVEWTQRLRASLAQMLDRRGVPVFTVSFGIVESGSHAQLESMISAADMALYRAKSDGRNRCVVATPEDLLELVPVAFESDKDSTLNLHMLADLG